MNEKISAIHELFADKFNNVNTVKGTLYIVSTPIGNIEDISFRALKILKDADLIAAEDTRSTGFLLSQYGIKNSIVSYYSQVEPDKADRLVAELKHGRSIALVSDAGTPGISDPGNLLVSRCIENGIEVHSVPGASSVIHSLVLSGFSTKRFYFQGFLPLKKGRQTLMKELTSVKMTIIIFESPFRIYKTLKDIEDNFGNKEVCIARELTKKFEQFIRGRVKDLLKRNMKTKGEFVILINNNT